MTELEKYIQSYFGVNQEDLAVIASMFRAEQLNKNAFFLKTGGASDRLSFIRSGLLRIYVSQENGEVTQWISSQGYFVCDLGSLVFNKPARWTIQALTDCELYSIDKINYEKLGLKIPKWHELEKLFIAKCFTILEDRIFTHLSMSAEERYEAFHTSNKELFTKVPLQYIASMLGMSPETFSRIRQKERSKLS